LTANKDQEKEIKLKDIQRDIDLVMAPSAPERKEVLEKIPVLSTNAQKMDMEE
jgi:hypothetical protein